MALIIADRVKETTTTTGTGALALAGAVTGFRAFSSVCTTNDTCYYVIQAVDGSGNPTGDWEAGLGTYSAASTLTRTTVIASSNSNTVVTLAAGTKQVWIDEIAAKTAIVQGMSAAQGGDVKITGGTSSTSANAGGAVTINGGTPGVTGKGGAVTITAGMGGNNSGDGADLTLQSGGPPPGQNNTTGNGGAINITAGGGFSAYGGVGGAVNIKGGLGGASNIGGAVNITGGDAHAANSGGAVAIKGADYGAAAVSLTGGSAYGSGTGGVATVAGGAATQGTTGTGGNATLIGGAGGVAAGNAVVAGGDANSNTTSQGGHAIIRGGVGGGTHPRGDIVLDGGNGAALSTSATGGFVNVPTCAGTPTGVPATTHTGTVPMLVDTTNSKLWFYIGGAWKSTTLA